MPENMFPTQYAGACPHSKLHEERQLLIKQWDEAMEAMKQRDEAIQVTTCSTQQPLLPLAD